MKSLNYHFVLLILFSGVVQAGYYVAPLSSANWEMSAGQSSCQLIHHIPSYGMADFSQVSGEQLRFSIKQRQLKFEIENASLTIKNSPWNHQFIPVKDYSVNLDYDEKSLNHPRLSVFGETAENMLNALSKGFFPTFVYTGGKVGFATNVAVSSVNFIEKYKQFSNCRQDFFPFGFKTLLEKDIFFKAGGKALSPNVLNQLKNTAKYIKEIKGSQIAIVSETEIAGNADKRWFLKRANMLTEKLKKMGVAKNKVAIKRKSEALALDNKVVQLKIFGPDALKRIYYRKGNTQLTQTEKKRLDVLIQYAKEYMPKSKLVIRSHTDSKGSRISNFKISQKRGEVIKNYLISKGMDRSKVRVKAYGETKPERINRFESGRAQNRRVSIDFTG